MAFPIDIEQIGPDRIEELRLAFRFDPRLLKFTAVNGDGMHAAQRPVPGTPYQQLDVRWRPDDSLEPGRIGTLVFEAAGITPPGPGVRLPLQFLALKLSDGRELAGKEVPLFQEDSAEPQLLNADRLVILEKPAAHDTFRARLHAHRLDD